MPSPENADTSDTPNPPKAEGARPQLKGDRCQCPSCREYFNSTYAFDRHRVGQFEVDRRCLATAEMVAKGMAKNAVGYWVARKMPLRRSGKRLRPAFGLPPQGRAPRKESRPKSSGLTARVALPGEAGT